MAVHPPMHGVALLLLRLALATSGCIGTDPADDLQGLPRPCAFVDDRGEPLACVPNPLVQPLPQPTWPEYACVGSTIEGDVQMDFLRPGPLPTAGAGEIIGFPGGIHAPGQAMLIAGADGAIHLSEWTSTAEPTWVAMPESRTGKTWVGVEVIETAWADPGMDAPLGVAHSARPIEGDSEAWNMWTVVSSGDDHALAGTPVHAFGATYVFRQNATLYVDGAESVVASKRTFGVAMGTMFLSNYDTDWECTQRYIPVGVYNVLGP